MVLTFWPYTLFSKENGAERKGVFENRNESENMGYLITLLKLFLYRNYNSLKMIYSLRHDKKHLRRRRAHKYQWNILIRRNSLSYIEKILQLRSGVLTIKVFQFVFAIKKSLLKINWFSQA